MGDSIEALLSAHQSSRLKKSLRPRFRPTKPIVSTACRIISNRPGSLRSVDFPDKHQLVQPVASSPIFLQHRIAASSLLFFWGPADRTIDVDVPTVFEIGRETAKNNFEVEPSTLPLALPHPVLEPCLALFWPSAADSACSTSGEGGTESRRHRRQPRPCAISLQPTKSSTHIREHRTLILRRDHLVRASRFANKRRALQSPNFCSITTSTICKLHHGLTLDSLAKPNAIISFSNSTIRPPHSFSLSCLTGSRLCRATTSFPSRTASFRSACTPLRSTNLDPRLF